MAEATQNWIRALVLGALCLSTQTAVFAQSNPSDFSPQKLVQIQSPQSGSLAGRLTDLRSAPLAGVSIVLRNQSTGVEVRTTTARNGAFRFASLDAGNYTLDADDAQLGHGRLEGILVTGGIESRVQAAMHFEPVAPALLEATTPAQIAVPPTVAAPFPAPPASRQSLASSAPPIAPAVPVLPRPVLSTSSPQLIVSVIGEPLRLLPLTVPTSADAIRTTSAQPAISAHLAPPVSPPPASAIVTSPPAAPAPSALQRAQPQTHVAVSAQRPALETQSAPIELVVSVAEPNLFPVRAGVEPLLTAAAVPPNLMQAAVLSSPPVASAVASSQPSDPVAPAVSTTISASQLQALPASGRRWQEFLLDTPAAGPSADSSQASYRASQVSAEVTVDGATIGLAFGASAGYDLRTSDSGGTDSETQNSTTPTGPRASTGGRGLGVSEAAIREVSAAAGNVEADGMHSAGGRTTIHTESGSNALHGQGFLFDRQNTWGAENPSTQWVTETAPAGELGLLNTVPVFDNGPNGPPERYTPPDHETVWGIGAGSQIRRDKLFWFAALDSYRRNDPGLAMVKHPYLQTPTECGTPPCAPTITGLFAQPSDAQMQLLSAQLGLPSASPVDEALMAYSCMLETLVGVPKGTSLDCAPGWQLAGLLGPAPRAAVQWVGFARLDWQAAERHRFTLEGIGTNWNSPGGGLTGVSANYGNHSFGSSQATQQWLLARWEAYLTPNLLAVSQGSTGRTVLSAKPDAPSAFEKTFLTGNAYGQLPQIVVDSSDGFTIGNPSSFGQGSYPDERLYHGQEMLDWVHNKLLVKAGFELDHDADATSLLRNQTGTYTYSTVQAFISDALVFEKFGLANLLSPQNPHNCDPTGKAWTASNGQLMGLGALPCYSHYSQMIGPTNWNLSTNDWAGYGTAQWQPGRLTVFSIGLRWEREQMPPPLAALANTDLPQAGKMPDLGNNWGPRVSLAIGSARSGWPLLRLGYGMYYGRIANTTIETALTQTGSLKGDLSYFIRPIDGYTTIDGTSAAPPFPYVLTGQPSSIVRPGAIEFASNFRNPEVHQAVAAIEQPLPGRLELTASMMLSLGRRLPVFIDTNLAPPTNPDTQQAQTITYNVCDQAPSGAGNGACGNLGLGPIKATQITVPFYASTASTGADGWLNPGYQQVNTMESKANSTYEGAMVKLTRYGNRGLSLHAHYTYAHATDWNPGESPLDAVDLSQEYGNSNLDVRHSAAIILVYETPWKLRDLAGHLGNGWMLSGIGQFHSGLPYTMRVTGSLPEEFDDAGNAILGLGPSMNGSGGDNRVYGVGSDGRSYNIGRNTFRYPNTWKADLRLGKKFDLGETRQLEILAESFNLFNHQNVTEIEATGYIIEPGSPPSTLGAAGTPPTLNFLTGLKTNSKTGLPVPAFGQPLNINATDFYRERQIQIGLRMRF